jgi:hypothetical protein
MRLSIQKAAAVGCTESQTGEMETLKRPGSDPTHPGTGSTSLVVANQMLDRNRNQQQGIKTK